MNNIELAKRYIKFQNDIGQFLEENMESVIPTLFADSFRKIANGVQSAATRDDLRDQLLAIRQQAGKWTIDVKEMAALQDPQRCLIRYLLVSTHLGTFDVMATLRANRDGLIEEIDEIYYQIAS